MVSTRAFLVVATCLYLKRVAEERKTALLASRAVLEVEDVDLGDAGEGANLMEWVDLSNDDMPASRRLGRTASAASAIPFPKDSVLLRSAVVCSIIPSDEPPTDGNQTFTDVAKSMYDSFWQGREADDNAEAPYHSENNLGGEEWDSWTGVMRLRTATPTPTSELMTLPILVTPPISSERRYTLSSAFNRASSALGGILGWTQSDVTSSRSSNPRTKRVQTIEEYPLQMMSTTAVPALSQAGDEEEEEDLGEGVLPVSTNFAEKRSAVTAAARMVGLGNPKRPGGWMRVDVDDMV